MNVYNFTSTELTVKKEWKDINDKIISPEIVKIAVQLFKNGSKFGSIQELGANNNWTYTFKDLPTHEQDGDVIKEIQYTVREVNADKELMNGEDISLNNKEFTVYYNGDITSGITITNKQKPTLPPTGTSSKYANMGGFLLLIGGAYLIYLQSKNN